MGANKSQDAEIIRMIKTIPLNVAKRNQIHQVRSLKEGLISKDLFVENLKNIEKMYDKKGFNPQELMSFIKDDTALETASGIIEIAQNALQLTNKRFEYFKHFEDTFPDTYRTITISRIPVKEYIEKRENYYFGELLGPLNQELKSSNNMSLEEFNKRISKVNESVKEMPEKIEKKQKGFTNEIDSIKSEMDKMLLENLGSVLWKLDESAMENFLLREEMFKLQESHKNGTLDKLKLKQIPPNVVKLMFYNESFAKASEIMIDIQKLRYNDLIEKRYEKNLNTKDPKKQENAIRNFHIELEERETRVFSTRRTYRQEKFDSIEEYTEMLQKYASDVKEAEIEAEYEHADSSELIMLIEKMNHNPKNLAQAKTARELRNGKNVVIPEGEYTKEELEKLFEAPTARRATDIIISTNEEIYNEVYSKSPKNGGKGLKNIPFEEASKYLDENYKNHIVNIGGIKTLSHYEFKQYKDRSGYIGIVTVRKDENAEDKLEDLLTTNIYSYIHFAEQYKK